MGRPIKRAGQLLRIAAGGLLTATAGAVSVPVENGSSPPLVSMSGWWDASTLAIGDRGAVVPDKSTASKDATTSPKSFANTVAPRRSDALSGMFSEGPATNSTVRFPIVEDYAVNANGIAVGTGQALAVMLTWSRPNQRQPGRGAFSAEAVSLLKIDGVDVLKLAGAGAGADPLILFPAGAAHQAGSLSLRHTRGVLVQFNAGLVDVWLDDGTNIFSGKASAITLGATANLSLLSDAHMIFHEACAWGKVLTTNERTQALSYMQRWRPRDRHAANMLWCGQSNSSYIVQGYAREIAMSKYVAYLTGSLSANMLFEIGGTIFSGQGLYDGTSSKTLNSSNTSIPASEWPLGANGVAFMAYLDSLTADQRDNIFTVCWYWNESVSAMLTYAKKAEYNAAMRNIFARIRTKLGRTAAQLPILVINGLPFSTDAGIQTHREVITDLANDPAMNVHDMLPNANDANGLNSTTSAEGVETGGDSAHRDAVGAIGYSRRMPYTMARAIQSAQAASGKVDTLVPISAELPMVAGPRMQTAQYESSTMSVLVTVAHDVGTDIVTPGRAAQGAGFSVMDGINAGAKGTPGTPGALIKATSCVKVNSAQFRIFLTSAPQYPAQAQLYYPYGDGLTDTYLAEVGRGNAVTDNFASIVPSAPWRVGAYMGVAEQTNHPLHATAYGLQLT